MISEEDLLDEELIESIAKPILDALLRIQEGLGENLVDSKIIVAPFPTEQPILSMQERIVSDSELDGTRTQIEEVFMKKLEKYLQEQIREQYTPPILH